MSKVKISKILEVFPKVIWDEAVDKLNDDSLRDLYSRTDDH